MITFIQKMDDFHDLYNKNFYKTLSGGEDVIQVRSL